MPTTSEGWAFAAPRNRDVMRPRSRQFPPLDHRVRRQVHRASVTNLIFASGVPGDTTGPDCGPPHQGHERPNRHRVLDDRQDRCPPQHPRDERHIGGRVDACRDAGRERTTGGRGGKCRHDGHHAKRPAPTGRSKDLRYIRTMRCFSGRSKDLRYEPTRNERIEDAREMFDARPEPHVVHRDHVEQFQIRLQHPATTIEIGGDRTRGRG